MGEAAFWGLVAGGSLVLGGGIALAFRLRRQTIGLIMAFGAGVLLAAVAYELVLEAYEHSNGRTIAAGLAIGALAFFGGDALLARRGGGDRKDISGDQAGGSAVSIALGTLLDGIPEAFILGLGIVTGGGVTVAYLVAVFLSNLPEAIGASAGLRASGWSGRGILGMWSVIALISAISAAAGYLIFSRFENSDGALLLAFAGGAVLTMLASTMIPEAFEEGGKAVGLATVLGFTLTFLLSALE